jgi:hypothetical protein
MMFRYGQQTQLINQELKEASMPTVADVIRFENGVGNSKRLIYGGASAFDSINAQIEAVESAMMEEFGVTKEGLKNLPKDAKLGPKATAALQKANGVCFSDPMNAAKATAVKWTEAIDEWRAEAKRRGATYIVIGNDSWDYEDYPVYATSAEDARKEERRMEEEAGVYHVKTIKV